MMASEHFESRLRRADLVREAALVGDQWIRSDNVLQVFDPATGLQLGTVPSLGREETERAIAAAAAALPAWKTTSAAQRSAILERWYNLIVAHRSDLAVIITAEQGKPLLEAEAEIDYAASFVKWFAAEALRVGGYDIPSPAPSRKILVRKEPVGVCAAITPWNFPAAMITRKLAPALAAGCTMVLKPSELTPFTALALALLAREAGVPAGAISVVTGEPAAIGGALTSHDTIRKLSFTGSTHVGRILMGQCAGTLKRLSLELGGNAPFIIFDDADIDAAVAGVMASKFRNAGQTCVSANRILVQDNIHDQFVDRLAAAIHELKVGAGFGEKVTIGPLISDTAVAKFTAHLEDALAKGGRVAAKSAVGHNGPNFVSPVLIVGAQPSMRCASEETFGPLAAVIRFSTEDEAIAIANGTPFGLAAYFYAANASRIWRVSSALEFGMVGINSGTVSTEVAPFGGVKQSGLGREGGSEGIDEYLEIKALHWSV
jgi:succinate-semialdehyde dehydrogenase / glutarate-semialdehyde dehydrogenase